MASYLEGKTEVTAWIKEHFAYGSSVLDVGACDGCWRRLLLEYKMDAVEIYRPYAERLRLYDRIFVCDISDLQYDHYDLIIFGDVIEHMTIEAAQKALAYAYDRCQDMIIAVPYLYKQGEVDGNPYQRHIQDDLTPEVFAERYSGFTPLWHNKRYCYYHKGGEKN